MTRKNCRQTHKINKQNALGSVSCGRWPPITGPYNKGIHTRVCPDSYSVSQVNDLTKPSRSSQGP